MNLNTADIGMGAEQGAEAQQAPQIWEIQCRDRFSMQIIPKNTDRSLLKPQIGTDDTENTTDKAPDDSDDPE